MNTTSRSVRSFAAALVFAAGSFSASLALADDTDVDEASLWSNDVMHFAYGDDLAVETRRVTAPDGEVEIVTVRLEDPAAGTATGRSWVAFTLYRSPVALDGAAAASPADVLEYTLAHNRTATGGATQVEFADVQLGGDILDGVRVTFDGVPGVHAAAAATRVGDATVVAWYHRDPEDAPRFDELNDVMATFAAGPAPEPSTTDVSTDEESGDGASDDEVAE
jgi:hypothetical protein